MTVSPTAIGRIKDNYGTTVLPNNTTTTRTVVCPTNRRWWLFHGIIQNADNVARVCQVQVYNSSDQLLVYLFGSSVSASGVATIPYQGASTAHPQWIGLPMKAGDYIKFTWTAGGASAGGTAYSAFVLNEVVV